MEINFFEKPITSVVIESLIDLSLMYKKKHSVTRGQLYTSYRKTDKVIKLGYTYSLASVNEDEKNLGYNLINSRAGTLREKRILKATLEELGFKPVLGQDYYRYSNKLIRYLQILGWPVKNLKL